MTKIFPRGKGAVIQLTVLIIIGFTIGFISEAAAFRGGGLGGLGRAGGAVGGAVKGGAPGGVAPKGGAPVGRGGSLGGLAGETGKVVSAASKAMIAAEAARLVRSNMPAAIEVTRVAEEAAKAIPELTPLKNRYRSAKTDSVREQTVVEAAELIEERFNFGPEMSSEVAFETLRSGLLLRNITRINVELTDERINKVQPRINWVPANGSDKEEAVNQLSSVTFSLQYTEEKDDSESHDYIVSLSNDLGLYRSLKLELDFEPTIKMSEVPKIDATMKNDERIVVLEEKSGNYHSMWLPVRLEIIRRDGSVNDFEAYLKLEFQRDPTILQSGDLPLRRCSIVSGLDPLAHQPPGLQASQLSQKPNERQVGSNDKIPDEPKDPVQQRRQAEAAAKRKKAEEERQKALRVSLTQVEQQQRELEALRRVDVKSIIPVRWYAPKNQEGSGVVKMKSLGVTEHFLVIEIQVLKHPEGWHYDASRFVFVNAQRRRMGVVYIFETVNFKVLYDRPKERGKLYPRIKSGNYLFFFRRIDESLAYRGSFSLKDYDGSAELLELASFDGLSELDKEPWQILRHQNEDEPDSFMMCIHPAGSITNTTRPELQLEALLVEKKFSYDLFRRIETGWLEVKNTHYKVPSNLHAEIENAYQSYRFLIMEVTIKAHKNLETIRPEHISLQERGGVRHRPVMQFLISGQPVGEYYSLLNGQPALRFYLVFHPIPIERLYFGWMRYREDDSFLFEYKITPRSRSKSIN